MTRTGRADFAHSGRLWAVAVPVRVRYEGDLLPGAQVAAEIDRSWGG